ncbi:UNVERIFIED_CONTAM: hypothetical protein K2H54_036562 [Gekko kuhli]
MGCAVSGPNVNPDSAVSEEKRSPSLEGALDLKTDPERAGDEEAPEPFLLSEAQKGQIRASWEVLHKDIARVGVIVFISLAPEGMLMAARKREGHVAAQTGLGASCRPLCKGPEGTALSTDICL